MTKLAPKTGVSKAKTRRDRNFNKPVDLAAEFYTGCSHEGSLRMSVRTIFFSRPEFDLLLRFYGRMVAGGEWRDYAIDALPDRAIFSVYRRTSEAPLFQIEKRPDDARRQGAFSVRAVDGRILRRGHELDRVLAVLEPKRMKVVGD
jgi:hypothetical protein